MEFCENSRFVVSLSEDKNDATDRMAAIKNEAMATCVLTKWAGLVQMHALASVLGCKIYSIYPNVCHGIRPLFHGCIYPRGVHSDCQNDSLYIMWTRDSNFDNRPGSMFQPNHFVPLVRLVSPTYDINSTHDFPQMTPSLPKGVLKTCGAKSDPLLVNSTNKEKSLLAPKRKRRIVHGRFSKRPRSVQFSKTSPVTTSLYVNEGLNKRKSENILNAQNLKRATKTSPRGHLVFPLLSKNWYSIQAASKEEIVTESFSTVHRNLNMSESTFSEFNVASVPEKAEDIFFELSSLPDTAGHKCESNASKTVHNSILSSTPPSFKADREECADVLPFKKLSCKWYDDQITSLPSKPEFTESFNSVLQVGETKDLLSGSVLSSPQEARVDHVCENNKNVKSTTHPEFHNLCCFSTGPSPIVDIEKLPDIVPFRNISRHWYECQIEQPQTNSELKKKNNNIIPFNLSHSWYKRRGRLAKKNLSRVSCTSQKLKGTLEENIRTLKDECEKKNPSLNKNIKLDMIKVGEYMLRHGPFIPTQEIGRLFGQTNMNQQNSKRRKMSSEIFKRVKRYFNVIQIYLKDTGYLVENKEYDPAEVAQRFDNIFSKVSAQKVNEHVEKNVSDLLETAVRFADTKKDRDLIKGLFARTTSVKHTAKMLNIKNPSSIRNAEHQLDYKLHEFECLERTSQTVRNDLTNEQQRRLSKRVIACKKQKLFKLRSETRGRALIADLFPELKMVLEEIFNYGTKEMIGGLESHPRLTTDIMYRSMDNNLFMRQAREILLKVSPPGLGICLSSCYNYTESYKEKTHSAKRHHAGKNINARISLQCPPRTNVVKHVVNLHWTTKNVNLLLESANGYKSDCVVDSKDAKTIICGDIQPVQNPGKSWKPISYPDHTFDQSRTNAVYPMTHLFLDDVRDLCSSSESTSTNIVEITRTGRPVSLINIAITEPETTFRAMNELLYLISQPSLDSVFRNSETGRLRSVLVFLVDNGHGEDPDSPLTQMCLARILFMLNLSKISQRSFAEYHSKRNFVERVHASENVALSRHGSFNSKQLHPNAEAGSAEHLENMEKMAEDVKDCLSQARFAGRFLQCFRGIGGNGVFNDEVRLKDFLKLSEERKKECEWTYSVESVNNPNFQALVDVWNVPQIIERKYTEDYDIITNNTSGRRTCWKDKYSTNLYGKNWEEHFEFQPIPDFVSWQQSGELHYLSHEKTLLFYKSELIKTPELFLPSRILENLYVINNNFPDDILPNIALLSWLPMDQSPFNRNFISTSLNKDFILA